MNAYNFVADSFHIKKLCSRVSLSEVRFYTENGRFAFSRGKYDDHLRLIGKCVVDFLLMLNEIFSIISLHYEMMLRLRRDERILVQNRRFRSNGGRLTQNFT